MGIQLDSSSDVEYQQLLQKGFPFNIKYENLISTYSFFDQSTFEERSKNLGVLLNCIGIKQKDFKLGLTRIFFRSIKSSLLKMIQQPSTAEILRIKKEFKTKLAELVAQEEAARVAQEAARVAQEEATRLAQKEAKVAHEEANVVEEAAVSNLELLEKRNNHRQLNENKVEDRKLSQVKESKTGRQQTKKQQTDREQMPTHNSRFDKMEHYPLSHGKRARCKLESCELSTVNYCRKCKVHLCIKKDKDQGADDGDQETNCFIKFHRLSMHT